MSAAEMRALGWRELDVLLVAGDAYIDHPACGAALLGRWLVAHGYRAGIVAQPRWDGPADVMRMGRPRLFAGVTAGSLDSMLAHYTAFRKLRQDDAYTPGGAAGARPNRAVLVYASLVQHAFPGLPVVLGGVEASMRRAAHYDFWSDRVRRSILLDSKADVLVYGMGERAILEIARRLDDGTEGGRRRLRQVPGTAFAADAAEKDAVPAGAASCELPSFETIVKEPAALMEATLRMEQSLHRGAVWVTQASDRRRVVFAPPSALLAEKEMDALYALPFARRPHPAYTRPIPGFEMIQFSVTTHRGCAGGCSFCAIAQHQGRTIQSRGRDSVVQEVRRLARHPDWGGGLTDVGGPSANMWRARCAGPRADCRRVSCLFPEICPHFKADQATLGRLLVELAGLPGVRHVRVASGVRHDLAMADKGYFQLLAARFTGGQLKLAPEHCVDSVLRHMRKPPFALFEAALAFFKACSKEAGKEQYILPYLISAFPGCTEEDMRKLAGWLRRQGWSPQQVQCFIPTPGTVATAMYHAAISPDGRPIHVARSDAERLRQHYLLAPRPDGRAAPGAPQARGAGAARRGPSARKR